MSEQFDELRLAGCLAAIDLSYRRATVVLETPDGPVEDAAEAAVAASGAIELEDGVVTISSAGEVLWTGSRAEFTEAIRRFSAFTKDLDRRLSAPDN
jgi:hypothetical protein